MVVQDCTLCPFPTDWLLSARPQHHGLENCHLVQLEISELLTDVCRDEDQTEVHLNQLTFDMLSNKRTLT